MKFSTSFLYLEKVAHDPLIRNFPILAAFQGEKLFISRSKVAPKWPFRFPGTSKRKREKKEIILKEEQKKAVVENTFRERQGGLKALPIMHCEWTILWTALCHVTC